MTDFPSSLRLLQADLEVLRARRREIEAHLPLRLRAARPDPSRRSGRRAPAWSRLPKALSSRAAVALLRIKEERGLSLSGLARLIGAHDSSLVLWLGGRRPAPLSAERIEASAGVPAAWWREPPEGETP